MQKGTGAQLPEGSIRRDLTNGTRIVVLIFILGLSILLLYYYRKTPSMHPPEDVVKGRTFTLRFSVTYENRGADIWNLTEEDYTVGLFSNNSWQMVYLVNHSLPVKSFEIDEDGNYVAVLDPQANQVFPHSIFSYDVEYTVVTKPRLIPDVNESSSHNVSDILGTMRERFCEAEGPWQIDDPEIVSLAHKIAGNKTRVLTIVKEFVKWIKGNISYRSGEIPKYPNETLKERFGDCDDQANLLITFCRIYEIPAHLQIGCIYLPSKANETSRYWDDHYVTKLARIGWHGWAMVYVPPWGWLPVDLTYAKDISVDPLNAVKRSAITLQETVQYLNITRTDYIASSASLRSFVEKHSFYIREYEEMTEESAITIVEENQEPLREVAVSPVLSRHPGIWRRLINEKYIQ